MNKIKIYKVILLILILAVIVISIFIINKYIKNYNNEKNLSKTIQVINNDIEKRSEEQSEINIQIEGNKVIGIIKIPKISLEYPILEKTDKETLKLSITKFWGNSINEIGNIALAGHNNLNGTMFGKIKKLQQGDIIQLTDIQKVELEYKVYKTYIIDPNDITCILPEKTGVREVTLLTCTNGNKNRFVVKARQIEN